MMRYVVVGMLMAASGSAAFAGNFNPLNPTITGGTVSAIGPTAPRTSPFQPRGVPLTNFSVYTGVASAAGTVALLESAAAPTADDVVTIGNLNDPINQYVAGQAGGIHRFVSSSTSVDMWGFDVLTIQISGRQPTGAPGDLFPSGFAFGGNQYTQGAVALGLAGMPASLGGTVPVNTAPQNYVNRMSVQLLTDGLLGPESLVPASAYGFGPTSPWNGSILRYFPGAATGPGVTSDIFIRITLVPTPGAGAVLGLAGIFAARRRRR